MSTLGAILTLVGLSAVAVAALYLAVKVVKLVFRLLLIGGVIAVAYFLILPRIEHLLR